MNIFNWTVAYSNQRAASGMLAALFYFESVMYVEKIELVAVPATAKPFGLRRPKLMRRPLLCRLLLMFLRTRSA